MAYQKMKILIIEDDRIQAENLKEILLEFGYEVIGPAYDSIRAMYLFKLHSPDLMLVDIILENSPMNGIEIVDHLKKANTIPVIFLSANYDVHTREKAKKVNPNYFLTKPIYSHQLDVAIDFALYNFMLDQGQTGIQSTLYFPTAIMPEYIFIKNNLKYVKINLREIAFLKASGSSTEIHLNYKSYIVSSNIADILEKFNCEYLVKTHRSHAVNINAIQSFTNNHINIYTNSELYEIPLTDNYRQDFLNLLTIIKTK